MQDKSKPSAYQLSGVDVGAGDALVDWLIEGNSQKKSPHANRIVSGIGGFASLFRADFPQMKKPLLVTCTDGVGTKVKLAAEFKRYKEVAQDLVAMCVNDLICTGGVPLLFLDYYATGKLDLSAAKDFLGGVRAACEESMCALVGGETAEMPGVYAGSDFDCAGFAVGVVDEELAIGPRLVKKGDRVIGIASSGFHSNGYSLLRKVFQNDLDKWIDQLLIPTRLYVQWMIELQKQTSIHAAAHITGGGMENVPRVLPEGVIWKRKSWEFPEIFKEVQVRTKMSDQEMTNTLNCGIGFVVIVDKQSVDAVLAVSKKFNYPTFDLGSIE